MELVESDRVKRMGLISKAMQAPESFVLRIIYKDEKGVKRRRVVSPIRFVGQEAFSALCLCREQPRTFKFDRCESMEILPAADVLMPVAIEEVE